MMILHLHPEENGPVWKRAKIPKRRKSSVTEDRSIPMLMPVPKEGSRPEGGLVIAGVANKREGKNINVGDLVCGQLQEKGPWAAEGEVEQVCPG